MTVLPGRILEFIREANPAYYGKLIEIRSSVAAWLEYVPVTFPHYTRHTLAHSDEILVQLSNLLIRDSSQELVVPFSEVELYILAVAAYLHDVGMVVSDREKARLLESPQWRAWTSLGEGATRWKEIGAMRSEAVTSDNPAMHFACDLLTRHLIAELVRKEHHIRSSLLAARHEELFGGFSFGDPLLMRSIQNVCLSHGLSADELRDSERFPDRCDIRGERANIKMLAVLLRLGDLLDMSSDRACPLLLNAACPLPAESLAHWSQYQRIIHRSTEPDVIELLAECETQEEHRYLQDWCEWLVKEVDQSRTLLTGSRRHGSWTAPLANLRGPDATIHIRPSPKARYRPVSWNFRIDIETVFERLIGNLYRSQFTFIRELIQNALDAMRCRMYSDLKETMLLPDSPTKLAAEIRNRYPLIIELSETDFYNELAGKDERRQVLTIDDSGIGMTEHVITNYLLQIGKSYYTSLDFAKLYSFTPSSKFGLGILSVFLVSDHVRVETKPYKDLGHSIVMVMRGPRSYLLTEKGDRIVPGTRIEVVLRQRFSEGAMTEHIQSICKRVEFPIIVVEGGKRTEITAESQDEFEYEMVNVVEPSSRLGVRGYKIDEGGVEGEVYLFYIIKDGIERWDLSSYARYTYPELHPLAVSPPFPQSLTCLQGIALGTTDAHLMPGHSQYFREGHSEYPLGHRIDMRGHQEVTLSREITSMGIPDAVTEKKLEILREHLASTSLANGPDGWHYKQGLMRHFDFVDFWRGAPDTVAILLSGLRTASSLRELIAAPILTTVQTKKPYGDVAVDELTSECVDVGVTVLHYEDLNDWFRAELFKNRKLSVIIEKEHFYLVQWLCAEKTDGFSSKVGGEIELYNFRNKDKLGVRIHEGARLYSPLILNENNPFIRWLIELDKMRHAPGSPIDEAGWRNLIKLVRQVITYHNLGGSHLNHYIRGLGEVAETIGMRKPPDIDFRKFEIVGRNLEDMYTCNETSDERLSS